jgi:hypothetical protein
LCVLYVMSQARTWRIVGTGVGHIWAYLCNISLDIGLPAPQFLHLRKPSSRWVTALNERRFQKHLAQMLNSCKSSINEVFVLSFPRESEEWELGLTQQAILVPQHFGGPRAGRPPFLQGIQAILIQCVSDQMPQASGTLSTAAGCKNPTLQLTHRVSSRCSGCTHSFVPSFAK